MSALLLGLLVAPALAGSIYINGVRADEPPAVSLVGVDVRIDGSGNVYIDAPRYNVQVVGGGAPSAPSQAAPAAAPASSWFLVAEDSGSRGAVADVYVNDRFVRRLSSGDAQVLVDLGPFVVSGYNSVRFVVAQPPEGGALRAYVGAGGVASGALRMDTPAVNWTAVGSQPDQRFSFVVP